MESGDLKLKQDFEDLQLQQRQKMIDRMKSKSQQSNTSMMSNSQSFGLGDDLNLTTEDVSSSNIAGLHTALEDANTRMREEIRELKDETGRLRKNLAEKDYDIKSLNKKILKMEDDKKLLASAGAVSDTAAMKIVDLSKRNRELTAEREAEKTKSLKLMKQLAELEKSTNTTSSSTPRKKLSPRNTLAINPEVPSDNVEELNDKLQSCYIKMAEYRNQIQELKQELKIANKVLQQEIGEPPATMQLILSSGGSGFRGRTQQIMTLQDKVKDLEQKLMTATGRVNLTRPDKNQERIKNMEKQRKEQTEELRNEIMKANDINMDLQRKIDATRARNKVLVNEVKSLKAQISVLTDKGTHDNELIMTLMKQHENLQKIVEHNVSAKDNIQKAGIVFSKEVISRQQQEQAEIGRLRQLLSERDARLRHLEQNIQELMNGRSSREPNSSPSYQHQPLAVFSSPSTNSISDQQNRTPDRPPLNTPSTDNLSPDKMIVDNSAYLQEIDHLRVELTKYQALHEAASIECEKLTEIVKVLTQRSEQSSITCQDLNRTINDEKRKTAKLEHSLDHLKASMKQDSPIKESSLSGIPPESKISELETLLSIQTDENTALKESLQSTLRAKQEDVAMFHDLMEQTKTVFMDALRSLSSKT
ncbi:coiled-coil domain-containing protein 13-like isoform X1 [Styela clava]